MLMTENSQNILKKKNEYGEITLPDFKSLLKSYNNQYNEVPVSRQVQKQQDQKDTHTYTGTNDF